jgi:hypothetical protein
MKEFVEVSAGLGKAVPAVDWSVPEVVVPVM